MKIIFKDGDLLEAEENLILHQVNCQGKMGSGIAVQVKKKWYNVYEEYYNMYRNFQESPNIMLGMAQVVGIGDKKAVVNLFGQNNYGYDGSRYTSYDALMTALERTAVVAKKYNLSVAIPNKLGSDRGGASWNVVLAMIEESFKDNEKDVVIYKYSK